MTLNCLVNSLETCQLPRLRHDISQLRGCNRRSLRKRHCYGCQGQQIVAPCLEAAGVVLTTANSVRSQSSSTAAGYHDDTISQASCSGYICTPFYTASLTLESRLVSILHILFPLLVTCSSSLLLPAVTPFRAQHCTGPSLSTATLYLAIFSWHTYCIYRTRCWVVQDVKAYLMSGQG